MLGNFCGKNFCDFCVIHKNHENIRPRKFGAIWYVRTCNVARAAYTYVWLLTVHHIMYAMLCISICNLHIYYIAFPREG